MHIPNFFLFGAPKCGTTALYEYLRTHPNVFLPRLKEPHFFADDFLVHNCGFNLPPVVQQDSEIPMDGATGVELSPDLSVFVLKYYNFLEL